MRICFTFILCLVCSVTCGQKVEWLEGAGSKQNDISNDLSVDKKGGSYFVGNVSDTATFDNIQINFNGKGKTYFAKFDSAGNVKWVDTASKSSSRSNIAIDNFGNTYVYGSKKGIILPKKNAKEAEKEKEQEEEGRRVLEPCRWRIAVYRALGKRFERDRGYRKDGHDPEEERDQGETEGAGSGPGNVPQIFSCCRNGFEIISRSDVSARRARLLSCPCWS